MSPSGSGRFVWRASFSHLLVLLHPSQFVRTDTHPFRSKEVLKTSVDILERLESKRH